MRVIIETTTPGCRGIAEDTRSDDQDIYEMASLIRQALLAYGYQPDSVNEILPKS